MTAHSIADLYVNASAIGSTLRSFISSMYLPTHILLSLGYDPGMHIPQEAQAAHAKIAHEKPVDIHKAYNGFIFSYLELGSSLLLYYWWCFCQDKSPLLVLMEWHTKFFQQFSCILHLYVPEVTIVIFMPRTASKSYRIRISGKVAFRTCSFSKSWDLETEKFLGRVIV